MARKPIRSPLLGYVLMAVGGAALLSTLFVGWRPGNQAPDDRWHYLVFAMLFLGPTFIYFGAQLVRRDASSLLADADVRPVVYLRPFCDEDLPSPGSAPWYSFTERFRIRPMNVILFAGFLGPVGVLVGFALNSMGGIFATMGQVLSVTCLSVVYVLIIYAPFYAYRMIRGRLNVTLEQVLSRHLGSFGPFVAIGEPGEVLAPEGAARVYLDDDTWQKTVVDMIERAGIIVVHVVPDGWTWWEFCQSMNASHPFRVLAVIGGEWLNDKSYGVLKVRVRQELDIDLPDTTDSFTFLTFDSKGSSQVLPISRKWWFLWPFTSYRMSRSTFTPFIERLGFVFRFSFTWWQLRMRWIRSGQPQETA